MPIENYSYVPAAVDVKSQFYGPLENEKVVGDKKKKREEYNHAFGETMTLADGVVYDANAIVLTEVLVTKPRAFKERIEAIEKIKAKVELDPKFAQTSTEEKNSEAAKRYVDNPKNLEVKIDKSKIDVVVVETKEELDAWLNPVSMVDKYSEAIEEHLHRRVNNFLLQMMTGFGSRLHFEVGPTQDQGESATTLYVEYKGEYYEVGKRNAAHSSTFPCLLAYDESEWKAYEAGETEKPKGIYYLQKSDVYKANNSTIAVPRSINEADIAIDGARHASTFSKAALRLLNENSFGNVTIQEAMTEFLDELEMSIKGQKRVAKDGEVKRALEIYHRKIKTIKEDFNEDPEAWIFLQIDLMIDLQETSDHLRAMMLRIRADAIRRNMRNQSEIMSKVDALAKTILKEMTPGKKRAPNYYREAFTALVIDHMQTDEDKMRISKLFSLLNPETTGTRKAGLSATKETVDKAAVKNRINRIKSLAKTLENDMRTMRTEEVQHRGDSMRALRNGKKWTQVKLGKEVRKRFPDEPSSQPTICRTERGERVMTRKLARELSTTFNVPEELLLPQFFFV